MDNNDTKIEIPGYHILGELGKGAMATVYLAIQQSFGREIALKVMSSSLSADEDYQKRFDREAKIVGQLSHPHIVPVYDVGFHNGHYYLAMEYLKCGDLKQRIAQSLTLSQALTITQQIAGALSFAHKQGFIHRDVKPDNILFRDDDTAVLTDFGIARTQDESGEVTVIQSVIGTPHYMSPEQALGERLDAITDIYSLGVVLYQMLTGKLPFTGANAIAISMQRTYKPVPLLPDDLTLVQPLVNSLLANSKAERIQQATEVSAAIDTLQAKLPVRTKTQVLKKQVDRSTDEHAANKTEKILLPGTRRWPRFLPFALGLGLAGVLATYYLVQQPDNDSSVPAMTDTKIAVEVNAPTTKELEDDIDMLKNAQNESPVRFSSEARDIETSTEKSDLVSMQTSAQSASEATPLTIPTEESENEQRLDALYNQANSQLGQNRLTRPRDDNALQTFNAMLSIDAENERATNGIAAIVERYVVLARQRKRDGKLKEAVSMVDRGLQIDAQSEALLEFRLQLSKEVSDRQNKQEIERLLALAEQQIEAGNYMRPAGDNAYASFKTAQVVDPDDERITQGMRNLLQRVSRLANEQQELGNWQAALTLLGDALSVTPEDKKLVAQKDEINELLQQSLQPVDAVVEANEPEIKQKKRYKRPPLGSF